MAGTSRKHKSQSIEVLTRAVIFTIALAAGCVGPGVLATGPAVAAGIGMENSLSGLAPRGPVDSGIPTPESVVGHAVADGAVRYEPMVRYFRLLAERSPLVTLTDYAQSHEGRNLFYLTITSKENHARLLEIKNDNAKLADPRKLIDGDEAERILDTLPGVAWLAYSIHGDELSSTDAALELAYRLAAGTDQAISSLRDQLVIHIDPLQNPDGRERYLGQLQNLTGKVPNPDYQALQHVGLWSAGRGNHYLFDLNRDWLMQVHPETRGRTRQILEWNPHLVVDSHEMGSMDTYLFDPPREPHNVNLSESNLTWRRKFSADQAAAFDRHGWSYYTREWYEEWYPGYTNAWVSLLGSIGLLYEQAGVNAALIKQPAGNTLTYSQAVHHQLVSSLANLETLRANRREVLADYLADQRWAVSGFDSGSDPGAQAFLVTPPDDRTLLSRFVNLLERHGIEVSMAADRFQANDVVDTKGHKVDTRFFPAGTLIVRAAQPRQRLLRSLLEFDPHMSDSFLLEERKDLENHRGTRVYDVTAWNLGMAYGLNAFWADELGELPGMLPPSQKAPTPDGTPGYGYLIDGNSGDIYRAIARLLDSGCKIRVATEPFTIANHSYPRGTVLLRNHENSDELPQIMEQSVAELDLDTRPVHTALSEQGPDLGGRRFRLLVQPRIALASQWPISSTSFGAIWHLLDVRVGMRVSPVNLQVIGRSDLRKYNVIVLPRSWGAQALSGVLNKEARTRLASWIKAGGTLVAMGGSAAFVSGKDNGLSSVRLRRDVLDQLSIYQEALTLEKKARDIQVDPQTVWNGERPSGDEDKKPTTGESDSEDRKPNADKNSPDDTESLKRLDAWQRMFSSNGAMVAGIFDPEHWLCFGLPIGPDDRDGDSQLPLLHSGSYAFMSKYPVATPVRLADSDSLRLSGLLWPEARRRTANTAYATVERMGNGQVILFCSDPFFRGYLEGTGRLLLNALLLGPGLGTSQPAPW